MGFGLPYELILFRSLNNSIIAKFVESGFCLQFYVSC